jgi:S1-C subfamily serine protease
VRPGSPAALAGIRTGDVIVQLAGQAIQGDQDVHRVGVDLRYDQEVSVLVWRDGQTIGARLRT